MNRIEALSIIIRLDEDRLLKHKKLLELRELLKNTKQVDTKGKPCSKDSKSYDKCN